MADVILQRIASFRWRAILLGGLTFWTPDLFYHLVTPIGPPLVAIISLTILMPVSVGLACTKVRGRSPGERHSVALSMLLGIYLLGPTVIMLNSTPFGGGFSNSDFIADVMMSIAFGFLPPCAFVMATYDMSLFALIVATLLLIGLHFLYEHGRGLRRPGAAPTGSSGS